MAQKVFTAAEVEAKVHEILLEKLVIEPVSITPISKLNVDLGADSMDTLEMIMFIEDEFGIEIPDNDIKPDATVGEIVQYLQRALNAGVPA